MNVRPLHDRIIVQRLEELAPQPGAIIIPDSARKKPQRGKVLAAGLGITRRNGERIALDVRAGDIVLSANSTVRRSGWTVWNTWS